MDNPRLNNLNNQDRQSNFFDHFLFVQQTEVGLEIGMGQTQTDIDTDTQKEQEHEEA